MPKWLTPQAKNVNIIEYSRCYLDDRINKNEKQGFLHYESSTDISLVRFHKLVKK